MLSTEPETPEQTLARLERDLAHVNEQLRVEHVMMLSWKTRALQAEAKLPKRGKGNIEPDLTERGVHDDTLSLA